MAIIRDVITTTDIPHCTKFIRSRVFHRESVCKRGLIGYVNEFCHSSSAKASHVKRDGFPCSFQLAFTSPRPNRYHFVQWVLMDLQIGTKFILTWNCTKVVTRVSPFGPHSRVGRVFDSSETCHCVPFEFSTISLEDNGITSEEKVIVIYQQDIVV